MFCCWLCWGRGSSCPHRNNHRVGHCCVGDVGDTDLPIKSLLLQRDFAKEVLHLIQCVLVQLSAKGANRAAGLLLHCYLQLLVRIAT